VAQEEKQNQIGQELHDNINQVLAVAKMQLGPLLKRSDDHHKTIALVNEHIQLAIDEIRKLSHRLVAPQFSEKNMTGILENLKVIVPAPAKFRLRVQDGIERCLNGESRLALYRIAQEQLNNINKYANAANISITLHHDAGKIFMIIQDDGIGFDTTIKTQGIGLRNIYTRAESLNGNAEIISSPGNGCKLIIKIPAVRSAINLG
jgi:signal transduction histidine kinase